MKIPDRYSQSFLKKSTLDNSLDIDSQYLDYDSIRHKFDSYVTENNPNKNFVKNYGRIFRNEYKDSIDKGLSYSDYGYLRYGKSLKNKVYNRIGDALVSQSNNSNIITLFKNGEYTNPGIVSNDNNIKYLQSYRFSKNDLKENLLKYYENILQLQEHSNKFNGLKNYASIKIPASYDNVVIPFNQEWNNQQLRYHKSNSIDNVNKELEDQDENSGTLLRDSYNGYNIRDKIIEIKKRNQNQWTTSYLHSLIAAKRWKDGVSITETPDILFGENRFANKDGKKNDLHQGSVDYGFMRFG
ncbi:unnamed protein product [Gordionus sp. m RMFG-2023]